MLSYALDIFQIGSSALAVTEAKLQELLKDREVMPVFDESIFEPEKIVYALGFTYDDIQVLVEFMRWHINQRNLRLEREEFIARRKTLDSDPIRAKFCTNILILELLH
jgi:hypothetical protein